MVLSEIEMGFETNQNLHGTRRFTFRKIISHSLALGLLAAPLSDSARQTNSVRFTHIDSSERDSMRNDPACGLTEIQNPLTAEYIKYLEQTYDREITVLDSNFVRIEPRYRFLVQIEERVPRLHNESERARAERVVGITRRLADLHLPPTERNIRDSIGAIQNARERYRDEPIFNETILFISGAVTEDPDSSESVYATPEVMARLHSLGTVRHFSGLLPERRNCEWATVESLESAGSNLTEAIMNTQTPITVLVRGHGSEELVELGRLGVGRSPEEQRSVVMRSEDFAEAFARRYMDERLAALAREKPDTVIFDDCYILPLATEALFRKIREIADRENRDIPMPFVITATEHGQLAFRGQLIHRLLLENRNRVPTFGMLFPDNDLLGNESQNSNATVVVRDRRGRPLQIG